MLINSALQFSKDNKIKKKCKAKASYYKQEASGRTKYRSCQLSDKGSQKKNKKTRECV